MRDGRPAAALVAERIPATLTLAIPALLIKIGLGIPAGVQAACIAAPGSTARSWPWPWPASPSRPSCSADPGAGLRRPTRLAPSGGQDSWSSPILPVITLGIGGAAILARFTRSAMLEVLGQPYIRAALAKGRPWPQVVRAHALPNAAIPTVTIVGFMVGSLMAGAVVVESVFSWPGVGRLLITAVSNRDLAVVQTILLLVAATMVLSNLIVDLLYGALDPRLRVAS